MNLGNFSSHNIASTTPATSPLPTNRGGAETLSSENSSFKPVEELESSARTNLGSGEHELSQEAKNIEDKKSRLEAAHERENESRERAQIAELSARDREVRAHEQAHMAAGGAHAGAASYQYERGPDGVNYAVAGEVPIDVSRESTPQETIQKAQTVKRAALAPADPSPQDRRVASMAGQMEIEARAELAELQLEQAKEEQVQAEQASEKENKERTAASDESSRSGDSIRSEIKSGDAPSVSSDKESRDTAGEVEETTSATSSFSSNPSAVSSRLTQSIENTRPDALRPGLLLDQLA